MSYIRSDNEERTQFLYLNDDLDFQIGFTAKCIRIGGNQLIIQYVPVLVFEATQPASTLRMQSRTLSYLPRIAMQ